MRHLFLKQSFLALMLAASLNSAFALPETIRIKSTLDPNAILITEVDIVFIYNPDVIANFPATKKAWYSAKFMMTRNAGTDFEVVNTFVPQGFDAVNPPLPERLQEAQRILVFAQHDASDTAAFDITNFNNALIEIDTFGIRVSDKK